MDLRCVPIWVCPRTPRSQLGVVDFGVKRRRDVDSDSRLSNWEPSHSSDGLAQRDLTNVEDEKPYGYGVKSSSDVVSDHKIESGRFHRDLSMLPKPLTATDLYPSPKDGSNVRVAYKGIPGAYSEAAALKACPNCETVPCEQFEAAFQAVELCLVDKAVLPIEKSVTGSIHRNYDLLLRHRLHIVREVQLVVDHCLLGLPGVKKEDLKCVLSHPQALTQCETNLSKLGVKRIGTGDSASAAQIVRSRDERETGAIASARAAAIYGLDILAKSIQDLDNNFTRFMILAREPILPRTDGAYKTSIVFSLEEGPGVLFKALAVFALRDISLTKIESRPGRRPHIRGVNDPHRGNPMYFDYLFYIDVEASIAEPRLQNGIDQLQEFTTFLRILGCYPMDTL